MRYLILCCFLVGCGSSWQSRAYQSLSAAKEANATAAKLVTSHYGKKCGDIAVKCGASGDKECKALGDCQASRRKAIAHADALDMAILSGLLAVQVSDEIGTKEALHEVIGLGVKLRELLARLGVL